MNSTNNTTISVRFGLKYKPTNQLVGYETESNAGREYCGSETVTLCYDKYNSGGILTWSTDSPEKAEYVRNHSTPWYNSSLETPKHSFLPEELEVVKMEVVTTITPLDVKIPSIMEMLEWLYAENEPGHLEYLKTKDLDELNDSVSYYNYVQYFKQKSSKDKEAKK